MTARRPPGSGALRRRGDRWQSSAEDPRTGRRRYRTWPPQTTKKDAANLHAEWLGDLQQRSPVGRQATLGPYLTRWLEARRADMTPTTWRTYATWCKTIDRELGAVRLAELDAMTITSVLGQLSTRLAPSSVKAVRAVLSASMRDAVAWGVIPASPVEAARMPRFPKKQRIVPTTEQVHALCAGEPDQLWRTLWEILAGTGCRPGEALALRWEDIDLNGRSVHIARTITADHNGAKIIGDETKTRRARKVSIDDHLASVLAAWRTALTGSSLVMAAPSAAVFASAHTRSGVVSQQRLRAVFAAGVARVGADPRCTPHSIRHWFVSSLVAAGVPAQVISATTGHSISEINERYGVHAPASSLLEVTRFLPARDAK